MLIADTEFQQHQMVSADATLSVLTVGDVKAKPIICVHGFPDTPHTFEHQIQPLLDAGFRIILPFLRGYPPSSSGKGVNYSVRSLAADIEAIIDQFCDGKCYLLGHDWGAITSYALASIAYDKIEKMIVAAVPPFAALIRAGGDLQQAWRSRYALLFQLGAPMTAWMRRSHAQGLDWLWSYWSPSWQYSAKEIADVKHCLLQDGAMYAATQYYRQLFKDALLDRDFMQQLSGNIQVPTLVTQGLDDGCIGAEYFLSLEQFFDAPFELLQVPAAGHFMHRENPDCFNRAMLDFLIGEE